MSKTDRLNQLETVATQQVSSESLILLIASTVLCFTNLGCSPKERVAQFEPNLAYAKALEVEFDIPFDQAMTETTTAVSQYFGTPDDPKLPAFLTEDEDYADYTTLVSMENLKAASGPPDADGRGLYRKHCVSCHGITGNGRGPTSALISPYPRDYRKGLFKFKSTKRGSKPTKEDLTYLIEHGIGGTSMVVIPELTEKDIEALVDYVIYLSWRGEFEREMLYEAEAIEFEPDEDGEVEHLFDPSSGEEAFAEQVEVAQDYVIDIADEWLEAEDDVRELPQPGEIPVPETIAELQQAIKDPSQESLRASIARGKELFTTETAACSKCHGVKGDGMGQSLDYDEWTKEWTSRIGLDPENYDELVPLIARGNLVPKKVIPRNFQEGTYRGGNAPEKIFSRIYTGIEGTPMPAATLPPEDIWHLVNYIRSLAPPVETAATEETASSTKQELTPEA